MENCKNYRTDNGDKWVIGGEIEFKAGSKLSGSIVAANVAASEATTVAGCVTSINAILTALKASGLMEADAT